MHSPWMTQDTSQVNHKMLKEHFGEYFFFKSSIGGAGSNISLFTLPLSGLCRTLMHSLLCSSFSRLKHARQGQKGLQAHLTTGAFLHDLPNRRNQLSAFHNLHGGHAEITGGGSAASPSFQLLLRKP